MLTLYYYGQIHGPLVTGTGNKIEDFGVGFFTKYGDGGVDISPIADLTKTQVYRLAEALGVDEAIQKPRRPTACGIRNAPTKNRWAQAIPNWSGQWACTARANPKILKRRQREVPEIYTRLHRAMQHKINPIPVCRIPPELLG